MRAGCQAARGGSSCSSAVPAAAANSLSARTTKLLSLLLWNLQSVGKGALCERSAQLGSRPANIHSKAHSPAAARPAACWGWLQRYAGMSRRPGRWEAGSGTGGGQRVAEQPIHRARPLCTMHRITTCADRSIGSHACSPLSHAAAALPANLGYLRLLSATASSATCSASICLKHVGVQQGTVKEGQKDSDESLASKITRRAAGCYDHHSKLVRFLAPAGHGSRGASSATDAPFSASGSTSSSISLSRCVSTSMPARACASRQ